MKEEKKHIGKVEFIAAGIAFLIAMLSTGLWVGLGITDLQLSGMTIITLVLVYFVARKHVKISVEKKKIKTSKK